MEVTDARQDLPPHIIHEQPQEQPPLQQQQFVMPQQWDPPPPPRQELPTFDFSKQTWVMISVVFALGLFMGKSLQPIIVKST